MSRYRADEARVTMTPYGSGLLVRWQSEQYFHDILASFRAALPRHGDCTYNGSLRGWTVSPYARGRLEQWLSWTFEPAAIAWEEGEPAGHRYGSTYSSGGAYGRYREPQTTTSVIEAAFATLHLLPSAPPEVAQAAHRAMLRLTHPDSGGTHEQAVAVNLAWEAIQADRHAERRAS
jgi:hypothetical protein